MEESHDDTIVESREEFMVSPTGGNPTLREAHFIKPSITSIKGPVFELPSHSLSSLPPTFEPKNWPLKVNFNGWSYPQKEWKSWVEKMVSLHETTWRKAGIYDPIMNSTYRIKRNSDLVLGFAEKWCQETKTFIFPWGEATITLEDVIISWGYSVLGSPVFVSIETEELKEIEEKLKNARRGLNRTTAKKAHQHAWMLKFKDSGSEIEHEAFLAMWLSRFVFASSLNVVVQSVFSIAVHLARGTRIALAPAVLASVYRDLSLLKGAIVESTKLGTSENEDDVLDVTLWSPFQLVQVWGWERFLELRPKPNLIGNGEPRLVQWHNVKSEVENVRLVLDSAKDSFNWRPYAKTVKNWNFPKFYQEKGMWVSVDLDLDDELQSFAKCLRPSELVGLDCIEQYLPHRVAMEFGLDQDLPSYVARSNESPEIAWSDYSKPISDVKLYIPSRLFEADVTTRYLEWWKQSVLVLQSASKGVVQQKKSFMSFKIKPKRSKEEMEANRLIKSKMTPKSSEGTKKGDSSKRLKLTPKSAKGTKGGDSFRGLKLALKFSKGMKEGDSFKKCEIASKTSKEIKEGDSLTSFKMTPKSSKEKEGGSFKGFKITPKSSIETQEGDSTFVHPGFSLKHLEKSPKILKQKKIDNGGFVSPNPPLKSSEKLAQTSKGKKGANKNASASAGSLKSPRKLAKSLKRKKEGTVVSIPDGIPWKNVEKSAQKRKGNDVSTALESSQSSKGEKDGNDESASSQPRKSLPLSFVILKDINNSPVPPGFPPKCNRVEARNSVEEDDELTIAESLKSNKHGSVENGGDGDNSSGQSLTLSSSIAKNEAVKNMEPQAGSVDKNAHVEAAMGGSDTVMEDAKESNAGSSVQNGGSTNRSGDGSCYSLEIPGLEIEGRINRLERLIAELKAARYGQNGHSSH